MPDLEKVIKALECCLEDEARDLKCWENGDYPDCPYNDNVDGCMGRLNRDALALLKAQEQRRRLEVHNIGNVDIPEGVSWEQFQAVMTGVVAALEHTEKGESWPYDKGEGRSNDA